MVEEIGSSPLKPVGAGEHNQGDSELRAKLKSPITSFSVPEETGVVASLPLSEACAEAVQ